MTLPPGACQLCHLHAPTRYPPCRNLPCPCAGKTRAQSRSWTDDEERLFLEALQLYGR